MGKVKTQAAMADRVNLRRVDSASIRGLAPDPVDPEARKIAENVLNEVRTRGEEAVREFATRFGDIKEGAPMVFTKAQLKEAADGLDPNERQVLERTADRIRAFAQAQRDALVPITVDIPGGKAGHHVDAVERAGCYAPGGRYPLPSSVLMTAVTARVAGCKEVYVASPRPVQATLAAAHIAGADALLCVGGAQAIAALVYGCGDVPPCDAVAGPGNKFVTAAKSLVAGKVAIDMLAGPSEVLVLADETADAAVVAADMLAQAEHDTMAVSELVTTSEELLNKVEVELFKQLAVLPTADVAREAIEKNGWACLCPTMEVAVNVCNVAAPEHLEVQTANAPEVAKGLQPMAVCSLETDVPRWSVTMAQDLTTPFLQAAQLALLEDCRCSLSCESEHGCKSIKPIFLEMLTRVCSRMPRHWAGWRGSLGTHKLPR